MPKTQSNKAIDEIFLRIRSNWGLKLALGLWVATGFTGIYLLLQRYPLFPITPMKTTAVDRMIPFVPDTVYLYESLWLIMPISLWLIQSKEDLGRYGKCFFMISTISFCVFFFFPTSSPRPTSLLGSNFAYDTLIRLDNERNAFPSLHAALAIFSGSSCVAMLCQTTKWSGWIRWFIWGWAFGIIASTLLTKQHVLIDAIAGALLGYVCHAICWRSKKVESRVSP